MGFVMQLSIKWAREKTVCYAFVKERHSRALRKRSVSVSHVEGWRVRTGGLGPSSPNNGLTAESSSCTQTIFFIS